MAVEKKELLAHLTPSMVKYMEVMSALDIDDLIDETIKVDEMADAAMANSILLKEVLMPKVVMAAEGDKPSYKNPRASVSVQTRTSPDRIDRTKLIALGVDPDLIDQATTRGVESDPFVVVRVTKTKGGVS